MRNLTAILCVTVAVLFGSAGVSWSADLRKGADAFKRGDYATALREIKPLAEQGNATAQFSLGLMYTVGKGVPKDHKTAVKWHRLAAEQGHAHAQALLGVAYGNGQGVPQDYKTAVKWYRLGAEQGQRNAQYNLGVMYRRGQGVPQNDKTAVKWYTLGAEQGHAGAQTNLGFMYQTGKGVTQNKKTAVKWYKLAAVQGNALARNNLKILQEKIAEQKSSPTITAAKTPTPPSGDFQKGLDALIAGDFGTALREWNLGVMYAFGWGVLKDYVYAHMWGNIAVSIGGKDKGKVRDFVEKKMTPTQISDAQDLARECVRKKYKGC
jgi:uncharacterized protein